MRTSRYTVRFPLTFFFALCIIVLTFAYLSALEAVEHQMCFCAGTCADSRVIRFGVLSPQGRVTAPLAVPVIFKTEYAPVMELVDMRDLGSRAAMRVGSSPFRRTKPT